MKMLLDYKKIQNVLVMVATLVTTSAIADKIHDPTRPKFVIKDPEAGADISTPIASIAQPTFPTGDVKLQGVLNKKGRTVAIISGKLYAVGDQISGYKINEINQDNVVLIGSGTQKRLYVYE